MGITGDLFRAYQAPHLGQRLTCTDTADTNQLYKVEEKCSEMAKKELKIMWEMLGRLLKGSKI